LGPGGLTKLEEKPLAKPAFIYAFDNLGSERFAELCGELLGSRYKGFGFLVLGGVGPDGGLDAELDTNLGIWKPESEDAFLDEIVRPGKTVIFQFKHKVVARAGGQSKARTQLLSLFRCRENYTCEVHRRLVMEKKPTDYVLVTNVEVNSDFRLKFQERCRSENPEIEYYQVIGLDELEAWITMERRLRHLYLPTIFGPPRHNLRVQLSEGFAAPHYGGMDVDLDHSVELLQVSILNVGTVPSYIGSVSSISFSVIIDGKLEPIVFLDLGDEILRRINPEPGTALDPGRKHTYSFPFEVFAQIRAKGSEVFPVAVVVTDEIGNAYSAPIPQDLREKMLAE
jgi:hypothetical protein